MLLNTLLDLTPSEFENFTFDLVVSAGLKDVIWRTPGADGGRDIQGTYVRHDFSGAPLPERWYVECKRYASSIDWPTIWSKVAYAQNHRADFLLLVTNSNPSPQAETELSLWNNSERSPKVRVWRGYEIERILASYPNVAAKYGLLGRPAHVGVEFLPLMSEIMKIAQSAYVSSTLQGFDLAGLETCAAISELIALRMSQVREYNRVLPPLSGRKVPDYPWLDWIGDVGNWEEAGLRACLSFLRYLWDSQTLLVQADPTRLVIEGAHGRSLTTSAMKSFREICLWADLELLGCDAGDARVILGLRV
jgi:hypothetical protein